jgi:AcrR family transcriptional regulator
VIPDTQRALSEPPSLPTRRAEQAEATRAALIAAARELFAQRGYAAVGTEEIVRRARVTRGALYHHFSGKEGLFEAVFEQVEGELTEQVAGVAMGAAGPWEGMRSGARAFLDACLDPAVQQITLLDAPSVLGWERWREIGQRYGLGLVQASVQAAIDAGEIEPQPVRPLAHLLIGALDEAAMLVARADDVQATRREVGEALERYLEALRR